MSVPLSRIRECFEGAIPACLATCAPDGTPNVTYVSQSEYVDNRHIALTFQFFNKTRENILVNPHATLLVIHPATAAMYRLNIRYLRTESSGPLFEGMKAKLAGIASLTGMAGVFRLLGSDVYEVSHIEKVQSQSLPDTPSRPNLLPELCALSRQLARCTDLESILDGTLQGLKTGFGIDHAMVLVWDEAAQCLYTVASMGYPSSGIGSEISLGHGVIGMAAQERTPIKITHMAAEYAYQRAIRNNTATENFSGTEIAPPGLADSNSQLAVPICAFEKLRGILFVESPLDMRFSYDDEDALVTLSNQIGMLMQHLDASAPNHVDMAPPVALPTKTGTPLVIRHYAANQAIFLDDDYLIKGVAGAIFWKLVKDYAERGRDTFSNRELRLDSSLKLPDLSDNLEARLILLQRRRAERCPMIRIEKTGRGRFRLVVSRPLQLQAL
jgi:adenylate cyclase